ncbi:MAG: hypothetical protein FVQ79_09050 [Planctomycetes bacterium]|nr:hypothetical protein [Planctomycetota bacterium]
MKLFDAADFIALLTMHIPPNGIYLIRRYGLYSSRNRGKPKVPAGVFIPEGRYGSTSPT